MLSKEQARFFFLGGTFVVSVIFLAMTWHSIVKEVPNQTHEENITPEVIAGKRLFDENNCMGCHTILGEGAYYAPELTKVYERKGEGYIKAVLMSPTPWQGAAQRKMVAYEMTEEEANNMVAFFKWINEMDLNGFPPEPDENLQP
jgi:nitric oxide reductase subunit C